MPTLQQLKQAFISAYDEGDMDQARHFKAAVEYEENRRANDPFYAEGVSPPGSPQDVPGYVSDDVPWMKPAEPEPSTLEKVADVAAAPLELAATAVTAPAGVAAGVFNMFDEGAREYFRGAAEGKGFESVDEYLRSRSPEEAFQAGMEYATYQPRTETAQAVTETVADLTESLPPVIAPGLSELGLVGRSARAVAPVARSRVVDPTVQAGKRVADSTVQTAQNIKDRVSQRLAKQEDQSSTVGAAQLDQARLRQEQVNELPVSFNLMRGQATGDQGDKQFEQTMAKNAEKGSLIRERMAEQNLKVAQNVDAFIDATDEQFTDLTMKGEFIDEALQSGMNRDKSRINQFYRRAEAQGELETPIELRAIIDHINNNQAEAINSGLLRGVEQKLVSMRAARRSKRIDEEGDEYTVIEPKKVTLKQAEELRKFISQNTPDTSIDYREASLLRAAHDADTDGLGGDLYKSARRHHKRFVERYKGNVLMKKLTSTKPGTQERSVALEQVAEYAALSTAATGSNLKKLRLALKREGETGQQAWREIQGAVLRKMQERMLKTSKRDQDGNPIPSYTKLADFVDKLDSKGKLEILFNKKGAEQVRTLKKVAEVLYTDQPGTVNHSDTSTIMAFMVDMIGSSAMGAPVPAVTVGNLVKKHVEDKKLRARIATALKGVE